MRDPDRALWIRVLAKLLRPDHREEIVGDLVEERGTRMSQGERPALSACWLAFHLLRSALAGRMSRATLRLPAEATERSPLFRGLGRDIRYAGRRLRARPGLAAAAVVTLTIGIGITAGVFGIVNAVLFKLPPVPDIDRVVTIPEEFRNPAAAVDMDTASYEALATVKPDAVTYLSASSQWSGAITGPERTEVLSGEMVSVDYFRTLELTPQVGTFALSDGDRLPRPAVVISDRLWQLWFHGDPGIVGQRLFVCGDPLTIVGVAPRGFSGVFVPTLNQMDVWMPFGATPRIDGLRFHTTDGQSQLGMTSQGVRVMARLGERVSIPVATTVFASLGERINPSAFSGTSHLRASPMRRALMPWDVDRFASQVGAGLGGLTALVLLIACTNLANLLLADVLGRRGEFAVRLASGATRGHLVRSVLTETVILAGLGLVGGFSLAVVVTRWIASIATGTFYGVAHLNIDPSPDWRVLAFSAVIAAVAALGIGAGPAWRASRSTPAALLHTATDGTAHRGQRGAWLVLAQVAACTLLLIVAGLYVRSALGMMARDPGFDVTHKAMMRVNLEATGLGEAQGRQLLERAISKMRELPAVTRVFLATDLPLGFAGQRIALLSDQGSQGQRPQTVGQATRVSEGYLEAMRIPVIAGRSLLSSDRAGSQCAVVINERTAAALWPAESAVGHRLAPGSEEAGWCEVVGVARDTDVNLPGRSAPMIFRSFDQAYHGRVMIVVEAQSNPADLLGPMGALVRRLDPDVVVTDVSTVADDQARTTLPVRAAAGSFALLGVVALAIAMLGLYALAAHAVRSRTREIGVRIVLGAGAGAVKSMVLRQSLALIVGGLVPGLVLAFIAVGLLESTLFGIGSHDPLTFVAVPLGLVVVGIGATVVPARRAARVDPAVALRDL
jgi:predicted permease